jgi:hypothetical protein
MSYNISFDASNKADFIADISATNIETGAAIDFTGVLVSIEIAEENCTPIISTSIGNGITLVEPTVLQLRITATQMAVLRPISYRIGGVWKSAGETDQLFRGDFVVYDGIARIASA